jgi:hypothetical protein
VVPLYPTTFRNAGSLPDRKLIGATVALRAERGVTAEWLQRVVNCRIARSRLGEGGGTEMVLR